MDTPDPGSFVARVKRLQSEHKQCQTCQLSGPWREYLDEVLRLLAESDEAPPKGWLQRLVEEIGPHVPKGSLTEVALKDHLKNHQPDVLRRIVSGRSSES